MRLKLLMAGVVAGALAMAGAASAATELVVNGGFTGAARTGFTTVSAGGPTSIAGWTVLTNYVDWSNGVWQSSDGDGHSIDLIGGFGVGAIGQTIATKAGYTYLLTFDVSGNPDNYRGAERIVTISAGGANIGAAQYTLGAANSRGDMFWSSRSLKFVATSDLTQLVFTGTSTPGNCCWGAALDNVSVTAVPEPATWAMMIIGFGAAGSMVRTSRRKALSVA
jgi:choice-of-anchor C domain-containing protein